MSLHTSRGAVPELWCWIMAGAFFAKHSVIWQTFVIFIVWFFGQWPKMFSRWPRPLTFDHHIWITSSMSSSGHLKFPHSWVVLLTRMGCHEVRFAVWFAVLLLMTSAVHLLSLHQRTVHSNNKKNTGELSGQIIQSTSQHRRFKIWWTLTTVHFKWVWAPSIIYLFVLEFWEFCSPSAWCLWAHADINVSASCTSLLYIQQPCHHWLKKLPKYLAKYGQN